MYVILKNEEGSYCVGFFDPRGIWHCYREFNNLSEAESHVHYLNGGDE
jgi:hypothetical protein